MATADGKDADRFFTEVWERKLIPTAKGTPELLPKHTGKVIIMNEQGKEEVLEGAYFSNLDLLWYTADGDPHPDFEKYRGKKWSIKFKIEDFDQFGKEYKYENNFYSPMLLGEIGPVDWEHIPDMEKLEIDFGIKCGVFKGYDDPHVRDFLSGAACSYIAFTAPDIKLEQIEPLVLHLSFALLFDDQLDSNTFFSKQLTFKEINIVKDLMIEVLHGEKEPDDQNVDFEFPLLKPLCRYVAYLRDTMKERSATDEIFNRYVVDTINYLNAVTINNAAEWNEYKSKCKTGTNHRTHWDIRRLDSGCLPYFTCQLLSYYNKLDQKIHESHLWNHYRRLCIDHIVYCNDLLSHRKEMIDKETCNALYVRHVEEGRDFIEAIDSCVTDCNKAAVDIIELGNLMLKLHDNDKELAQAIYLHKASLLGHIQWYNYAPRYHNGIILDCVVHLNDDQFMNMRGK